MGEGDRRECVVCGVPLRSGLKYCYRHKSARYESNDTRTVIRSTFHKKIRPPTVLEKLFMGLGLAAMGLFFVFILLYHIIKGIASFVAAHWISVVIICILAVGGLGWRLRKKGASGVTMAERIGLVVSAFLLICIFLWKITSG